MKSYSNPILRGFYPDPSICRVDEDYYLVHSTFAYFPGITVWHSRDLANWRLCGHALDRPSQLDLEGFGVSRGIFAPTIRYHGGLFYITCTLVDGRGNFVVTAKNAGGPWSNAVWLPVNGIDPSLFFDEDAAWLVYNSIAPDDRPLYNGHRTIRMVRFDPQTLSIKGPEHILVDGGTDIARKPRWIEGPHLLKKHGYYYLIAAEGGTGYDHSVVVFRSHDILGPYQSYENNPILSQNQLDDARHFPVSSTGHADLVELPNGNWYAVFLGCRPYEGDHYNTGRETFLVPVTWTGEWPVLNAGHTQVEQSYPLPLPEHCWKEDPNADFRDDFDGDELDSSWIFLRTPREKWWWLRDGMLWMKLRPETCAAKVNPSFIARRQQESHCIITILLRFHAAAENEKAGLAVFQNEDHFYYLCRSVKNGQGTIELYRSLLVPQDVNRMECLWEAASVISEQGPLYLRIAAAGVVYRFYYSTGPETWQQAGPDLDARFLSTRHAGGFVGCTFALYATSLGQPSDNIAQFEWAEAIGNRQ